MTSFPKSLHTLLLALSSTAIPLVSVPLLVAQAGAQTTICVDGELTSGADDGTSWVNAFRGDMALSRALESAVNGDQVYVAQGTYKPTNNLDRTASFILRSGVSVYGGFTSTESSPLQRPPRGEAPTILSGDLLDNDVFTASSAADNSFQVVRFPLAVNQVLLDGFFVVKGNSNAILGDPNSRFAGGGLFLSQGANALVRNCEVSRNFGRIGMGIYCEDATLRLLESKIDDNGGTLNGGGAVTIIQGDDSEVNRCTFMRNQGQGTTALSIQESTDVSVTQSIFHHNHSEVGAAVVVSSFSDVDFDGCTIAENRTDDDTATLWAGLVIDSSSTQTSVSNSILWGNALGGALGTTAFQINAAGVPVYSIVEGGLATGVGNSSSDPQFVNATGAFGDPLLADYSLRPVSPAIDSGSNALLTPNSIRDLTGTRRRFDDLAVPDTGFGSAPVVDRGAFEYSGTIGDFFCSTPDNSTGRPAEISAEGSLVRADDDVTLEIRYGVPNVTGIFITSLVTNLTPGALQFCLAGSIGAFNQPNQIMTLDATGRGQMSLDLSQIAQPTGAVSAMAGQTFFFQGWFRDPGVLPNPWGLTDALALTFE